MNEKKLSTRYIICHGSDNGKQKLYTVLVYLYLYKKMGLSAGGY